MTWLLLLAAALTLLRYELAPVLADLRDGVLTVTGRRALAGTLEAVADTTRRALPSCVDR